MSVSSPYVSSSSSEEIVAVCRDVSQCSRRAGFVGAVEMWLESGEWGLVGLLVRFRRCVKERAARAQYVNPAGLC